MIEDNKGAGSQNRAVAAAKSSQPRSSAGMQTSSGRRDSGTWSKIYRQAGSQQRNGSAGAGSRAMGLYIGAVDGDGPAKAAVCDQGVVDALPDLAPRPAIEAVVDRGVGAVFGRAIAPAAPGLQDVDDPADDATVVDPASTRLITGQLK